MIEELKVRCFNIKLHQLNLFIDSELKRLVRFPLQPGNTGRPARRARPLPPYGQACSMRKAIVIPPGAAIPAQPF